MAINASSGGQLQGGTNGPGSGGGLTEEDVQDIVASQIEVGTDISIGLQTSYDDATGKLMISLAGGGGSGGGTPGSISIKEDGTARGTATVLNFVGPGVDVVNNVATITGGLDSVSIYENASNRGNFTSINFVSGATVTVNDGTANVTISGGSNFSGSYNDLTNKPTLFSGSYTDLSNKPALFSGSYADLSGKPTIPADVSQLTDTQGLLGSGGGSYTLPTASTSVLGGVKVDGSTITISNGVISSVGGTGGGVTLSEVGTYLNNNGYATQTYVQGQVDNLINGAPGALNTLNELAAAIASNPSFATDITSTLAGKVNLSGGTMTGALILSGAPAVDLQAATKKYVDDKFTVNAAASVSPSFASAVASQVSLSSLAGVSVGSMTAGQILGFNGTEFVPVANSGAKGDTGATGATGAAGSAGLSISAATVTLLGRLQLTLTDNSVVDAGNVSGIKSATVNGSGNLILTKQDNTTVDAGSVIGPQGATGSQGIQGATGNTGSQGPAGLSVTSASVNGAGRLLIVRSDSSTVDAGSVVGPQGAQGIKGDTGEAGATGPAGSNGSNGVGITTAAVNGSGRLIITKTDSSTVDAGSVIGPQGATGTTGAQGPQGSTGATGLGIYSVVVDGSGNLQVTLTDASTINAGSTVGPQGPQGAAGPAGRSIADSGVVVDAGGYLQVTLSDGSTINAGYVVGPQGSTGATGATGPQGIQGVKGDTGSTGATGTSYTVNGKAGAVQVYGLGNTTQPGYDLEVDLANKANKWTTARTLTLSGKVTGLTSFDGSGNITMTTALNAVTTNDISEGATNKYYTDARSRLALSSIADSNITTLISYDDATGQIKYRANTSYITEGSNQYFTNTRADARADVRIGAASINALADVDTVTAAPTNGQVLTWTGSAWTPSSVSGGGGAVSSVNAKTGVVVLNTDDVAEGSTNLYYTATRWDTRLAAKTTDNLNQGTTNKYFSDTLARNALAAGTGLSYNSSTGTFSINTSTDNVTEGSANLYYTTARFDTRLGQSNLNAFADVTNTTPTTGQALAWNGSAWAPTTISSGGGGGSSSSGVFRASVQVEYDASGNLSSVNVLNGGISAVIATATSTVATVTFTFTGSVCAPLNTQVYSYQRASNSYVLTAVSSTFTAGRTLAGGGSSGSPSAFSAFDPAVNTMTIGLTKAITGASAGVGQTTHCVVQFLLSSV